jgi:hypothetical protein
MIFIRGSRWVNPSKDKLFVGTKTLTIKTAYRKQMKNMETTTKAPRKIFEVIIHNRPYDVYDIEGKEHGGWNGEPKTWWLYYAERLPEGMIPPADSPEFEPWSKSINRRLWDIRFKEYNSSKEKWGETQFRSGLNCEMWCNNKLVYSFGTHDLNFAMAKAQYLIVHLSEHSYDFFNPEKMKGRKIFFYNLPATIQPSTSYAGEIRIYPDYAVMPKEAWWKEYRRRKKKVGAKPDDWDEIEREDDIESEQSDMINWGDALSDGHIWWHRD